MNQLTIATSNHIFIEVRLDSQNLETVFIRAGSAEIPENLDHAYYNLIKFHMYIVNDEIKKKSVYAGSIKSLIFIP